MGERRAGGGSGVAQDWRVERYRADGGTSAGTEAPAARSTGETGDAVLAGPLMSRPKALISWSSGKDSAFALHEIRRAGEFDVVGALTTVTETFDRVSIHGVRREILQAQLDAAGLPPRIVPIHYPCPNAIYEARMAEAVARATKDGISHI